MTSAEQVNQKAIALINGRMTKDEIDSIDLPSLYKQVSSALQPTLLQALARLTPPRTVFNVAHIDTTDFE